VHPTWSIEVREITGSVTGLYCTYIHYKRKKHTVRIRHTKKVRHRLALQAARAAAGLAHPVPRHPRRVVRSAAPGSRRRPAHCRPPRCWRADVGPLPRWPGRWPGAVSAAVGGPVNAALPRRRRRAAPAGTGGQPLLLPPAHWPGTALSAQQQHT
jgi:hypothetical protein